ncbi:MAG: hypothetical protein J6T15_04905 [Bacilli bacterium]|nr:hypothetical protein [Bacilli bacterium]
MRRGIKASLYLPLDCLDTLTNREEDLNDYFDSIKDFAYDYGSMEYQEKEVCYFDVILLDKTIKSVRQKYTGVKKYLKVLTGKQPKQIFIITFDKIM